MASHSQVGTHGSTPPHSTIRQRINCRGAIFCARPSMPPPCCIPLSDSALNVRAQNIAPLQDGASLLGSGSITAIPSPVSFAIHGSLASHRRVFFRRSRLFFREAAFSSGGEGCEWRAPRATVGESGDKAENEFSGFIPLAVPRKGESPHIPAPRLFIHFHTTKPQKREHSLLVLPSVHTILNFANKFFEMFTKKQS